MGYGVYALSHSVAAAVTAAAAGVVAVAARYTVGDYCVTFREIASIGQRLSCLWRAQEDR